MHCDLCMQASYLHQMGSLQSLDWNGGMEWWTSGMCEGSLLMQFSMNVHDCWSPVSYFVVNKGPEGSPLIHQNGPPEAHAFLMQSVPSCLATLPQVKGHHLRMVICSIKT